MALKTEKVAASRGLIAAASAAVWKQPRVDRVQSKCRVSGEKDSEGGRRAAVRNVLTYLKRPEPLKLGRDPETCRLKKRQTVRLYIEVTTAVCQYIRLESCVAAAV